MLRFHPECTDCPIPLCLGLEISADPGQFRVWGEASAVWGGGCRWGFVNVGRVEAPAQHTPASWAPVFMTLLPTSCELSRARAPEHLCCGLRAALQNYLMDSLTHQYWTFDCPKPDLGKRKENQPLFFIRSCDQNCHPFLTWAQASRSAGPPVLPIQVITELSGFSLCSSLTLFTGMLMVCGQRELISCRCRYQWPCL